MTDVEKALIAAGVAMANDLDTNFKLRMMWKQCLQNYIRHRPITAQEAGRKGGIHTSPAKANASRRNGAKNKKGGAK